MRCWDNAGVEAVGVHVEDFRRIVLRGANVASYKFALARSILALAESGATTASLEELAVPFSRELCTHLDQVDTQSTSAGSRFLDARRHFTAGKSNVRPPDTWGQAGRESRSKRNPRECRPKMTKGIRWQRFCTSPHRVMHPRRSTRHCR